MQQQPHRWEANDIINMTIVLVLGVVLLSAIAMCAILLFMGKTIPDIIMSMLGGLLTGVTGGLIGYLGARRTAPAAQPSPQVNMGDGSTTNVAPGLQPPPDPTTFPNSGRPA